jgi:hypothetical protein
MYYLHQQTAQTEAATHNQTPLSPSPAISPTQPAAARASLAQAQPHHRSLTLRRQETVTHQQMLTLLSAAVAAVAVAVAAVR